MRVEHVTLVLAFAFATANPTLAQSKPSEPDLLKILMGANARATSRAAERLLQMGAGAVPILLRGLDKAGFESPEAPRILTLLSRLRGKGVSALPKLLKALAEVESGHNSILKAFDAIAPYAPEQNSELIDAIANLWMNRGSRGRGRSVSARSIAVSRTRLDVTASMTAAELISILNSGNTPQREVAAELLVHARGVKAKKLTALRECLADETHGRSRISVRFRTARGSSGISTSTNSRTKEKVAVARAIIQLAATKDVPLEAWIKLLDDEEPRMLRRAMQAIGIARPKAAVKGLLTLTRHADPTIRWEAITTLGMLGPIATDAIRALEVFAKSGDKATAVRANAALRMIRPEKR